MAARELWSLPSAAAFLDEIEAAQDAGLAVIPADSGMPTGWEEALSARLQLRQQHLLVVHAESGCPPADTIGVALGCQPRLQAFLELHHCSKSLLVHLEGLGPRGRADWQVFLGRFHAERDRAGLGVALLCAGINPVEGAISERCCVRWGDRLRPLDVAIWADLHMPADRQEPLATLATALAVQFCGWRLDLAAEIARAGRSDLLNPLGWLERRKTKRVDSLRRFGGVEMRCPIALLRSGGGAELERRIWRAQLAALFPWIEELRLAVIAKHGPKLNVNEHLRALGVRDIEEIEFGAVAWQLRSRIPREEALMLECLARIRNALAHRKPASAEDLEMALKAGKSPPSSVGC